MCVCARARSATGWKRECSGSCSVLIALTKRHGAHFFDRLLASPSNGAPSSSSSSSSSASPALPPGHLRRDWSRDSEGVDGARDAADDDDDDDGESRRRAAARAGGAATGNQFVRGGALGGGVPPRGFGGGGGALHDDETAADPAAAPRRHGGGEARGRKTAEKRGAPSGGGGGGGGGGATTGVETLSLDALTTALSAGGASGHHDGDDGNAEGALSGHENGARDDDRWSLIVVQVSE